MLGMLRSVVGNTFTLKQKLQEARAKKLSKCCGAKTWTSRLGKRICKKCRRAEGYKTKSAKNIEELHEHLKEVCQNKPNPRFVHIGITEEPNGTIGLYVDGRRVNSMDFWIEDKRGTI